MQSTERAKSALWGDERGGRVRRAFGPLAIVIGTLVVVGLAAPWVARAWNDGPRNRLHLEGGNNPRPRTPPTTPPSPPPYDGCSLGRSQREEPLRNDDVHPLGVTLSNGELTLSVTDLVIPGRGLDLALTRSYRSQSIRFGALGRGWSLGLLDDRLVRRDQDCYPDTMFWERSDGGYVTYPWRDPWVADGGVGKIRRASPTRAEIRTPDGTVMVFTGDFSGSALNGGVLTRIARIGASPIEIDWDLDAMTCDPAHAPAPKPVRATLWSCDDDPITNPVGAADCSNGKKIELGRVDFDVAWVDGAWIVKSATAVQTTTTDGERRRKISYDYAREITDPTGETLDHWCTSCGNHCGDGCGSQCYPWRTKLRKVSIDDLAGTVRTVASYDYDHDSDSSVWPDYMTDNLKDVLDADGTTVMSVTYQDDPTSWSEIRDTVQKITTPSGSGGSSTRETNFAYHKGTGGPADAWPWIDTTTVTSGDRSTTHTFDAQGHVTRIVRPDNSKMDYTYDATLGRMTQAAGPYTGTCSPGDQNPNCRVRKWVYAGVLEHPVKYGVVPASSGHGEKQQWTCYDVEPVTNAIWRTYAVDWDATGEPLCNVDPNADLPAKGTLTTLGWMKAGKNDAGGLKQHLVNWGFNINELPFRGAPGDPPVWPWWSAVEERGRTATTVLDGDGTLAAGSQQPVTTYTYDALQGVLTTITRPDQSQEHFRYLAPQTLGPGAGAADGLGRLAQRSIVDVDNDATTVRSLTQYAYDVWGNVAEERRKVANGGATWLILHREYDVRNRLKWEKRSGSATGDPWSRADYCYDRDGRVVQKRVDRTADPTATSRQYALLHYEYNTAGLLTKEEALETASDNDASLGDECFDGTLRWSGSGASTDRRLAYDAFGNVRQEAVRLTQPTTQQDPKWRITRTAYDNLDRPVAIDAYAGAQEGDGTNGLEPPAVTTTPGSAAVRRLWYTDAGGVEWEQETGEETLDGTATTTKARLVHRLYDGHERLKTEQVCGTWQASLSTSPASPPSCSGWLNTAEVCWDREDRPTKRKGYEGAGTTLKAWEKTDYDDRGRPLSVRQAAAITPNTDDTDCDGTFAPPSVLERRTGYDVQDRVIRSAAPRTDGTYAVTKTTYDGAGRRKTVDLENPASGLAHQKLTLTRNLLGLVTEQDLTEEQDGTAQPTWSTTFGYDGLGRPTNVALQDENGGLNRHLIRSYDARGQVTAQWTPRGAATQGDAYKTWFEYDGLGRKVKEHRHIGAQDSYTDGWQDVGYGYDDGGRLTTVEVEPDGMARTVHETTTYGYDAQGRRSTRTLQDGRTESTTYDAAGRLTADTVTYSTKWVTRTSTYDDASRRTGLTVDVSHADASHYGGTTHQHWDYDGLGRVTAATDDNGDATNDGVTVAYDYDALSRVTAETWDGSGHQWAVGSTYDAAGRRATLSYPVASYGRTTGALAVRSAWDDLGRLTTLTDLHGTGSGDDEAVASFTYAGATRLTQIVHSDGSWWEAPTGTGSNSGWDGAGRRTLGRVRRPSGTPDTLYSERLTYDADDEVTRVVWDHVQRGNGRVEAQSYGVDELGRLTTFAQGDWDGTTIGTPDAAHGWALDELGNWRQHADGVGASWFSVDVDGSNNAYRHWPTDTSHDGTLGRERTYDDVLKFLWRSETATGAAVVQYVHDGLGRLVQVQSVKNGTTSVLVRFGYDAGGRLAWKTVGSTRTWFVWDGAQTLQEIVGGAVQKEYVWAGGRLVAATDAAGLRSHLHQDRLGSNVLATHASGGAVVVGGRAYYDPYGRPTSLYANDLPEPYGFAGARWEAFDADGDGTVQPREGLYLMGARWYDPEMGRFVEQDPIGESGGLNLYAYVGSSPTQWVDPTGLRAYSRNDPFERLLRADKQYRDKLFGSGIPSGFKKTLGSAFGSKAGPASDAEVREVQRQARAQGKDLDASMAGDAAVQARAGLAQEEALSIGLTLDGANHVIGIGVGLGGSLAPGGGGGGGVGQASGPPGVDVGGSSPQAKTMTMALSPQGLDFIKSYETLVLTSYGDGDTTNQTIGYGHKILPGETFTSITAAEAETLLARDVGGFELAVNRSLKIDIPQNQFDALVSLAFNAGPVAVSPSRTIVGEINAGQTVSAFDFLAWSKVSTPSGSHVYCQGLLNRRLDEYEMFSAGDYTRNH